MNKLINKLRAKGSNCPDGLDHSQVDDSTDPFWNQDGRPFRYAADEISAGWEALRSGSWKHSDSEWYHTDMKETPDA